MLWHLINNWLLNCPATHCHITWVTVTSYYCLVAVPLSYMYFCLVAVTLLSQAWLQHSIFKKNVCVCWKWRACSQEGSLMKEKCTVERLNSLPYPLKDQISVGLEYLWSRLPYLKFEKYECVWNCDFIIIFCQNSKLKILKYYSFTSENLIILSVKARTLRV